MMMGKWLLDEIRSWNKANLLFLKEAAMEFADVLLAKVFNRRLMCRWFVAWTLT